MADSTLISSLYEIQNQGEDKRHPILADLLSTDAQVFDVNLDERLVNIPQFLSVQYDHNAEIIYFKCPRYFDNMDLANTTCVVEYINAQGDPGVYGIPYYDITKYGPDDMPVIIMPWAISGLATLKEGTITFCLHFYVIQKDTITDPITGDKVEDYKYVYSMHTKPQQGQILHGMELSQADLDEFNLDVSQLESIYQTIRELQDAITVYWKDV